MHLNRYVYFTRWLRDARIRSTLQRTPSAHDGAMQTLLTLEPADGPARAEAVFLHGMDGDAGDGVVAQQLVWKHGWRLSCPAGRGACWLSDAFLADAGAVVRGKPAGVYLAGVSMGAVQALSLAALFPSTVRGVIAILPGVDLPDILKHGSHVRVRETLAASMRDGLEERSPIRLVDRHPVGVPVALVPADGDTVFPRRRLDDYVEALRRRGVPVLVRSLPGGHCFELDDYDYSPLVEFLGGAR